MSAEEASPRTLAVDIGGSKIKVMVLDAAGTPVTERTRLETPEEPTPEAVLAQLEELIQSQGEYDRVSVGFPGVIKDGVAYTAHNLDEDWIGFDLGAAVATLTGKPTRVANDADVQGLGVIDGVGVELVLTLGTGVGSALFVDGRLVANLELAHHPFRRDKTYEQCLGDDAYDDLGRKKWNRRLEQAIETLEHAFNFRMLYLGGGNAKKIELELPDNVQIVPNTAGLTGGIGLWRD